MNLKEPTLLLSSPVQVPTGGFSMMPMMSPFWPKNQGVCEGRSHRHPPLLWGRPQPSHPVLTRSFSESLS